MSVLHVRQIGTRIRELFESELDLSDVSATDPERDLKIQTRSLAAYAVFASTDCTEKEAALSVVDGGDDNGIDAIFYSQSLRQLVLVQSKWIQNGSGEPDSGSVSKFCNGIRDLFNCSFDRFNAKVLRRQVEIEKALAGYDTRYDVVVIDTGDRGLAEHSQRLLDDLTNEMNDAGDGTSDELVRQHRWNQAKVHSSLAVSGTTTIDLEIALQNWGKVDEPQRCYFGVVSAKDVAGWWKDHKRLLFDKNIRQVLGSTDVNSEIKTTLTSDPELFVYFNNGITIVADTVERAAIGGASRDSGRFSLRNAQVVNGAQTVSSIGRYLDDNPDDAENAKLLVRVVSLDGASDDFGTRVTRANNRQNRIENRDFASQDQEQIRIRTELKFDEIEYAIVRSDSFTPSASACDISEAVVALACASGRTELAVQAKREIGKFFENLSGGIYRSLFNPNTSGDYLWNCVRVVRAVEEFLQEEIQALPKRSGRRYGLFVHGNRLISLLTFTKYFSSEVKKADFSVDEAKVKETVQSIVTDLESAVDELYPESMLGTLFKNLSKCKELVTQAS